MVTLMIIRSWHHLYIISVAVSQELPHLLIIALSAQIEAIYFEISVMPRKNKLLHAHSRSFYHQQATWRRQLQGGRTVNPVATKHSQTVQSFPHLKNICKRSLCTDCRFFIVVNCLHCVIKLQYYISLVCVYVQPLFACASLIGTIRLLRHTVEWWPDSRHWWHLFERWQCYHDKTTQLKREHESARTVSSV